MENTSKSERDKPRPEGPREIMSGRGFPLLDDRKLSVLATFSRSQVSSFAATVFDYATLFALTEFFHVWYVASTAAGALIGAVTNFLLNRHWTFEASRGNLSRQARRYALASTGSLVLNTVGVFLVTEYIHVHYSISVIVVSLLVGFLFNYPMYRNYVYR